jgi:uroporphyrinogen decarboxylase
MVKSNRCIKHLDNLFTPLSKRLVTTPIQLKMIPKERMLTACARQEPDRVPLDYAANPGIDHRLKSHFGLKADDDEGLLTVLGVDCRYIHPAYVGPQRHPDIPGRRVDMWGIHTRWVEHASGGYWDFCDFPLKDASLETIEAWSMPSPDDFDYASIAAECERLHQYCLIVGDAGLGDIINGVGMIRSMERVLIDLLLDEPACMCYIERRLAVQLEIIRRTLEAARGRIDLLHMGEDLGSQNRPLISLDLYRRQIRPRHQQIVDLARHFNIPVMMHSCGSSSWAYDDFIDMGITVVDTLQPEARDMSPAYLKNRFGDRLAFHGCISTAGAVAFGSVTEVVEMVRNTLEIMMPGGGYILAPTHMLQDNSPTENVVAMYATAMKNGWYR